MTNENMEQETQGKTTNSINNQDNIQTHDSKSPSLESEGERTMTEEDHTPNLLRLKSGLPKRGTRWARA
jgi:hypothetical protein